MLSSCSVVLNSTSYNHDKPSPADGINKGFVKKHEPGKIVSEITLLGDPCTPSSRTGVYISSMRQSTSARSRSRHSIVRNQLTVSSTKRKGQQNWSCVIG
jgi:hypothetical protein